MVVVTEGLQPHNGLLNLRHWQPLRKQSVCVAQCLWPNPSRSP